MKMKKYRRFCRHPKTTQEIKSYQDNEEFVRGKRSPRNLPNSYDDKFVRTSKNWKDYRKEQYTTENFIVVAFYGRGDKYTCSRPIWQFQESVERLGYRAGYCYCWDRSGFLIDGKKFPDIMAVVFFRGRPTKIPKNGRIVYEGSKSVDIRQM